MGYKIEKVYAWVIADDGLGHGDEEVPALIAMGSAFPLYTSNLILAKKMKTTARKIAFDTNKKMELREFILNETVDVVEP